MALRTSPAIVVVRAKVGWELCKDAAVSGTLAGLELNGSDGDALNV